MKNLIEAVNKVAKELPVIGKNLNVGGKYQGVSWKDVASAFKPLMVKNGLVMIPIDYDAKTTLTDYLNQYGKPTLRVFTEVNAKYKLIHVSGESVEVAGLGYGVDNQDKGAGKATTYAMKNALMYMCTVAADMDDTENTHSDDYEHAPQKVTPEQSQELILLFNSKGEKAGAPFIKYLNDNYRVDKFALLNAIDFDSVKQALEGIQ